MKTILYQIISCTWMELRIWIHCRYRGNTGSSSDCVELWGSSDQVWAVKGPDWIRVYRWEGSAELWAVSSVSWVSGNDSAGATTWRRLDEPIRTAGSVLGGRRMLSKLNPSHRRNTLSQNQVMVMISINPGSWRRPVCAWSGSVHVDHNGLRTSQLKTFTLSQL